MASKTIQVKLVEISKRNDSVGRSFEISHAERILKMRNPTWELPKDSPYNLTENGLVKRANKPNTAKPDKQGGNK